MLSFNFDGKKYRIPLQNTGRDIQLPDGRLIRADGWDGNYPTGEFRVIAKANGPVAEARIATM